MSCSSDRCAPGRANPARPLRSLSGEQVRCVCVCWDTESAHDQRRVTSWVSSSDRCAPDRVAFYAAWPLRLVCRHVCGVGGALSALTVRREGRLVSRVRPLAPWCLVPWSCEAVDIRCPQPLRPAIDKFCCLSGTGP